MKNYKRYNIKQYDNIEGSSFADPEREKIIHKIVKLAGKLGWKYTNEYPVGKSLCVTECHSHHPNGKTVEESVTLTFFWKSSKKK
jgi:hypothetical protein